MSFHTAHIVRAMNPYLLVVSMLLPDTAVHPISRQQSDVTIVTYGAYMQQARVLLHYLQTNKKN